jgi:acyl-CoA dehydrogenase
MNPERILIAAELVGLGRCAVSRAAAYARSASSSTARSARTRRSSIRSRELDGARGGEPDGVQGRLALRQRQACGAEANAAKYLAGEACFDACQQAVMTHGGFGYAREYHVERYLRESFVGRIAPVSRELILCFIAERVLGLPKSYDPGFET